MKKFLLICALALAFTGCNKEANIEEGVKISETKTDVDVKEYSGEEKKLDLAYNTYSLKGLDTENLEMNLFTIKDGEVSNFVDGLFLMSKKILYLVLVLMKIPISTLG